MIDTHAYLIQISILDLILKYINSGKIEIAKDITQQFRNKLQDEVDRQAKVNNVRIN